MISSRGPSRDACPLCGRLLTRTVGMDVQDRPQVTEECLTPLCRAPAARQTVVGGMVQLEFRKCGETEWQRMPNGDRTLKQVLEISKEPPLEQGDWDEEDYRDL